MYVHGPFLYVALANVLGLGKVTSIPVILARLLGRPKSDCLMFPRIEAPEEVGLSLMIKK